MDRQKREFALRKMQERARGKETSSNKYAAGGAAKVRQGVATKSGAAITAAKNKGRSRK